MAWYLFSGILSFSLALWVLKNATARGAANPGGWTIMMAGVWFITLPLYLFMRRKWSAPTGESVYKSKIKPAFAIVLAFVLSFIQLGHAWWNGLLPACNDQQVVSILNGILNNAEVTNPAERGYKSVDEIRMCNATLNNQIVDYTVAWYDSDKKTQFIVRLE